MPNQIKPGIYRHYKGNLYEVIGSATHSETGENMVVYRALYGTYGLWIRPAAMFSENIKIGQTMQPRFTCIQAF
ncbi:DUF1653 domain-containing protein [Neisseria weaveri]|uniref:Uncharacterized protein conserved in bacteria n=1 Tax=Neisseria weaveri TaxID=28091 RepID=A0A3S5C4L4_9NEIS|nr:DUF1653 domain-containing protein [Neisseria weaveri]EGV34691.1 hypothetical protein l13_19500 [Neisseria weaveri ATCC 51223]EGV35807.1 hypothetical protein l11_19570 [Neisseria weaveri LMG 5135]SAY50623.1 Uncharacterized protein conserved in bacteria [Neisseria weaveri]VEJ52035.1 Uncharacterized protein conserved in bacteria [Neisseria weaveri]